MPGAAITVFDDFGLTVVEFLPFHPLASSVLISENWNGSSVVTDFPVEEGSAISDHVRPSSEIITLEVFVTNTPTTPDLFRSVGRKANTKLDLPIPFNPLGEAAPPVGTLGFVTRSATNAIAGRTVPPLIFAYTLNFDGFSPISDVNTLLKEFRSSAKLCSVLTTIDEVDNMVIVDLSRLRSAEDGEGGVRFSISFKQITTVTAETVDVPQPAEPRALPKVNKGSTNPVTDQLNPKPLSKDQRRSMLKSLIAELRGG